MRNLTARTGVFLILLTSAPSWNASVRAQEAVASTSSTYAGETSTARTDVSSSSDVGTGVFASLPVKVSFNVRGGYDDNITTSKDFKHGSPFTNAGAVLTYDFGDARTQLTLEAGAGYTYYWDNITIPGISQNDYDINTYLRLSASHKVTPRLTLSMTDYVTYQTEPDFTIAQGLNRRGGNYFFTQDKFTANYLWAPRFATATSYTLGALHYDDAAVGIFENRWENTFGNEFRFLLAPTSALVAEYRFQVISYQNVARDSTNHFTLAGFDHTFNPEVNVSFRGGAQFREYDQDSSNRTSPYFEGTLNYNVGKRTTVSWINRYSIEESDIAFNQSRKTFRTGISAKHEFTPKVTGSLSAYYEHDAFQSINQPGLVAPGFDEQSVDVSLSLRYDITRYLSVEAGYNYTQVTSDVSLREYTRNRYWGGVNLAF